ncbi:MAG: response regulator [Candidatus Omnitrophica bacterium]|nr:response regulator [Candidatus Omnitrophota bacterium]
MEILIIDDEEEILDCISEILISEGHGVTVSLTSEDSLVKLEQKHYDLVITDLRMPEINGNYLIEIIKAKKPQLPIIVLSGHIDSEEELFKIGACTVLSKPVSIDRLLLAVNEACGKDFLDSIVKKFKKKPS